ncbi:MAG: Sec-independent protein translocase protein TatA [Planctomycetota bacterium]
MLGFIYNLSIGEFLVVGVLAVLIFGGRLPEVAARVFHYVRRFRRSLEDLRRETGIDREIQRIDFELREADRQARAGLSTAPSTPLDQGQAKIAAWDRSDEEAVEASVVPSVDMEEEVEDPGPEGDGEASEKD